MEEKLAKQMLSGFADMRLNTAHLAWLVKLHAHEPINTMIEEFMYYFMAFRDTDGDLVHVTQTGESMTIVLRNPMA